MRKLKKYKVKLLVVLEKWNGYDAQETREYEVEAMNQASAYKKAEALMRKQRPGSWMRNGLGADLVQ